VNSRYSINSFFSIDTSKLIILSRLIKCIEKQPTDVDFQCNSGHLTANEIRSAIAAFNYTNNTKVLWMTDGLEREKIDLHKYTR